MSKKIMFTGGGTAGHIIPNIPLIEKFKKMKWEVDCFVLGNDLERSLLRDEKIGFYRINAGKFRRYFDFSNITDLFKVATGIIQCNTYIRRVRPNVIFSKGGFVAVPVAISAWLNKVPFIIHESDTIPSLTTKFVYPIATCICTGFPADKKWKFFGFKMKTEYTGIPLRSIFFKKGEAGGNGQEPTLLILGGSLGSATINFYVRSTLKILLKTFTIIHVCGKGKVDLKLKSLKNYHQYEFIGVKKILEFISKANIVITRGGATSLYELLYLRKPTLIIPLPEKVSRGDQISNALYFKTHNFGDYILEEDLTYKKFIEKIHRVQNKSKYFTENMNKIILPNSEIIITDLIVNITKQY